MTLATEPQVAGVNAQIADALAPADERRSRYLNLLVTKGGVCRGCGAGELIHRQDALKDQLSAVAEALGSAAA